MPSVLAQPTPMVDEYDPIERIMTKALKLTQGQVYEGKSLKKFSSF